MQDRFTFCSVQTILSKLIQWSNARNAAFVFKQPEDNPVSSSIKQPATSNQQPTLRLCSWLEHKHYAVCVFVIMLAENQYSPPKSVIGSAFGSPDIYDGDFTVIQLRPPLWHWGKTACMGHGTIYPVNIALNIRIILQFDVSAHRCSCRIAVASGTV
jgi:hypothetical protein